MKKILIILLCTISIIAGIAVFHLIENNKKHLKSDFILTQLKYDMIINEVVGIVGKLGPNLGSGRPIFKFKLPDGRDVKVFFSYGLEDIRVTETKGEWAGYSFKYDLDKQELIVPFKPDSLIGIQYGMTPEEIEKIFRGDSQQNVSFFGFERTPTHPIVYSNHQQHFEPFLSIDVYLIRLSTGEWVNMGFETTWKEFNSRDYGQRKTQLLYVNMKADDGEWYVYNLNTQELTEERVPEEKVWEGYD